MQWNLQPTYKVWHNDNIQIYLWGEKNHNMCYKHVTVQFVEGFYIKPPTSWGWEATIPY